MRIRSRDSLGCCLFAGRSHAVESLDPKLWRVTGRIEKSYPIYQPELWQIIFENSSRFHVKRLLFCYDDSSQAFWECLQAYSLLDLDWVLFFAAWRGCALAFWGLGFTPCARMNRLIETAGGGITRALAAETGGGASRVQVHGKFFHVGETRWCLKGYTYGPFAANSRGHFLPELPQIGKDFSHLRMMGANAIRLYRIPPPELLDLALKHDLRVMVDVPWEKHRCFFEDWDSQSGAVREVRSAAKELGAHPALFAISVGNEIPQDIVRFYGAKRVGKFVETLLDIVHEHAPGCPATYTNYPSTEFLPLDGVDFFCANVYLNDPELLGRYLDRLQHVAGPKPLILGELGVDSFRQGEPGQADALSAQVRQVFRRGLAGAFVFSYTDDWFTGGHAVEEWAFGVTDRARVEKPAAQAVHAVWSQVPRLDCALLPRVSVVVCSYNGSATLDECLDSLTRLEYPDYEVLLVDDGSTDDTPAIASRHPSVRYIRQENFGLSAARNTGMREATGSIVAYTDSDCVADPTWLLYLIESMQDQKVDAIGGPNVPPQSDNWIAKCIAVSPGGPSHVMLDDRIAEHVPGCNMAFDRQKLLKLGGFDPRFRAAGDDVDICWRFLDAGYEIGYAASALVWHHRRSTVRGYLRQQKGYGLAEGILYFKHRHRFNMLGCSKWHGVIYGEGAVGLPSATPPVYHGRFGGGPFQIIYRNNRYSEWLYVTLLEWHVVALLLLSLSHVSAIFWVAAAMMWCLTLVSVMRAAVSATLPPGARWWCRPLVGALHLLQPVVRAWNRYLHRLKLKHVQLPLMPPPDRAPKRTSWRAEDLYWSSSCGRGREQLLEALVTLVPLRGWRGDLQSEWYTHDIELWPDLWHEIQVRTATEELGAGKRFTRLRASLHLTRFARTTLAIATVWLVTGLAVGSMRAWIPASALLAGWAWLVCGSRWRCRRAVWRLTEEAGTRAGLDPVNIGRSRTAAGSPADPLVEHSQLVMS
jgi:GT2 family glycosyltransferase